MNVLTGTVSYGDVEFSGFNDEDGGMTTTSYTGTVIDNDTLDLTETWSWSGPGGDCPGGSADVTATRIL